MSEADLATVQDENRRLKRRLADRDRHIKMLEHGNETGRELVRFVGMVDARLRNLLEQAISIVEPEHPTLAARMRDALKPAEEWADPPSEADDWEPRP